jgi:hypothetical protein
MEVVKTVVDISTSFQAKHLEVSPHLIQHSRTNMAMLSLAAKLVVNTSDMSMRKLEIHAQLNIEHSVRLFRHKAAVFHYCDC